MKSEFLSRAITTVVGEAIRTITSMNKTNVVISDSLLEPNHTYTIHVGAKDTCETREAATVLCRSNLWWPPSSYWNSLSRETGKLMFANFNLATYFKV